MVTRSQIEQAKQKAQSAEQQIGTSRQQIQKSQAEIEATRRGLRPKKRIPFTPRKARLATTRFKRELTSTERKLIEQAKQLTEQEKEIQKYREEVLAPTETALIGFEKQQAAAQEKQAVYNQALSLYQRGKAWVARRDPRMRPIIQRIEAGERAVRDQLKLNVDKFHAANPSEKLIVDWDKIKIKGVSSGEFRQSMSFDEYNKRLGEISVALPKRDFVTYDAPPSAVMNLPLSLAEQKELTRQIEALKFQKDVETSGSYIQSLLKKGGRYVEQKLTPFELAQEKKMYDKYTQKYSGMTSKLFGGLVSEALRFYPPVLLAIGGEKLLTPYGQEALKYQEEQRLALGQSPIVAKGLTYGGPILEMALGGYGTKAIITSQFEKSAIKSLQANLESLGKSPIKDLTIIKKGEGLKTGSDRVMIKGFQGSGKFQREFIIEGDLIRSSKGTYFLPEAEGISATIGLVERKGMKAARQYLDAQKFRTGSKGISFKVGDIGDFPVYTSFGSSGFIPQVSTGAFYKTSRRGVNKAIDQLNENLVRGGTIRKEIELPYSQFDVRIKKSLSLGIGRDRMGLTIETSPPSKQIGGRVIGAKETPLSQTFQQEVIPISGVAKNLQRQSENLVSSLVPTAKVIPPPSVKIKTKELSKPIQVQRKDPLTSLLIGGVKQTPRVKDEVAQAKSFSQLLIPLALPKQKTRQLTKAQIKQIARQKNLEVQRQTARTRQVQKSAQAQRQKQLARQTYAFNNIVGPMGPKIPLRMIPPPFLKRKKSKPSKPKKLKKVKKKKEKKVLPTLSQMIINVRLGKKVRKPTGFEIARV